MFNLCLTCTPDFVHQELHPRRPQMRRRPVAKINWILWQPVCHRRGRSKCLVQRNRNYQLRSGEWVHVHARNWSRLWTKRLLRHDRDILNGVPPMPWFFGVVWCHPRHCRLRADDCGNRRAVYIYPLRLGRETREIRGSDRGRGRHHHQQPLFCFDVLRGCTHLAHLSTTEWKVLVCNEPTHMDPKPQARILK